MNAIAYCHITRVLPEEIQLDLLFVQMCALEQHLAATHPEFEKQTYAAITAKLAPIYMKINHSFGGKRIERFSEIIGEWQEPKRHKYHKKLIANKL